MELIALLILIGINGLFSMSEIALVSARKIRLEQLARKGDRAARRALRLAANPDRFLPTVQIGITLTGILLGILSGDQLRTFFLRLLGRWDYTQPYRSQLSLLVVVLIITYLTLVLGELVPKRIGLSLPESISKLAAPWMQAVSVITYPFIWVLTASTNLLVRLLGIQPLAGADVTQEDITTLIDQGAHSGTIEEDEQEIIRRVFHLGDRNITSLMTHRSDIIWIELHEEREKIRERVTESPHTVYPVCAGQIDHLVGGGADPGSVYIRTGQTAAGTVGETPLYPRRQFRLPGAGTVPGDQNPSRIHRG